MRLLRPTGVAVDPARPGVAYAADPDAHAIVALEPDGAGGQTARLVAENFFDAPARLAVHRFGSGLDVLLVLDLGDGINEATQKVGVVRLDTQAFSTEFLVPGRVRHLYDFAPGPSAPDELELYVAADFVEDFASLEDEDGDLLSPDVAALVASIRSGFEFECYDGLDDEVAFGGIADGADAADPDCAAPLDVRIVRLVLDEAMALGAGGAPVVDFSAQLYKRFPIFADYDAFCAGIGGDPAFSTAFDFRGQSVDALAVDGDGRVLFVDPVAGSVRAFTVVAGPAGDVVGATATILEAPSPFSLPFDGSSPLDTAVGRPRAILVDGSATLWISDTLDNRVRRVFVEDLLP